MISWQVVLGFISWLALPMNVALFVFTSWTFRQFVVVPGVADTPACGPSVPYVTTTGTFIDRGSYPFTLENAALADWRATLSPRALWYEQQIALGNTPSADQQWANQSFVQKCEQNVNDCWAPVGGVTWLPAMEYLVTPTISTPSTTIFLMDALCDTSSPLYNKLHCATCTGWSHEVLYIQIAPDCT